MIKAIKTSQPWINFEEKKNINLALKEKAISGFYGKFIGKFEKIFQIIVVLNMEFQRAAVQQHCI